MKRPRQSYIILAVIISLLSPLILSAEIIIDDIEFLVDNCVEVKTPVLIECEVMGDIRFIGLKSLDKSSEYYKSGLTFVQNRIEGEELLLDICHINPHTTEGYIRAVVYYNRDGKWWNLNVEMVREGIVRVVPILNCHVDPKAWLTDEKKARKERKGIWEHFKSGEYFEE